MSDENFMVNLKFGQEFFMQREKTVLLATSLFFICHYREQTKKKQKEKGIPKQTGEGFMETQDVNNSQIGGSQVLFPDSQSSIQSFGR